MRNITGQAVVGDDLWSDERTFASVLRDLEADGYLRQEDDRLEFRSNLLREWWRKHYARQIAP